MYGPPAPLVRLRVPTGATPTFAVFVIGTGGHVPFDPAVNRVFVRFKSGNPGSEVTRGATSVAVQTQ